MFDAGSRSEAPPRAEGAARVVVAARGGRTRLARLHQRGSAKCLLPKGRPHPEAVFLNTGGGITGGDRFSWAAEAGPGATLTVTTQAAERIYRSAGGPGRVESRVTLRPGATLHWLPQETILFDGGALERSLEIEMAEDARLLALEAVVLGRAAMGETVRSGHLIDRWRLRRGGRLVYADALRLSGPVADLAARPGLLAEAGALATLVHAAPDAGARLSELRARLPETAAASVRDGVLVARIVAPGAQALRRALASVVSLICPLPAVWSL